MSISVSCDTCGSKFTAPDKAAGRKVKCTKCGALLFVPSDASHSSSNSASASSKSGNQAIPIAAKPMARVSSSAAPVAPSQTEREFKECSFCGEDVLAKAKKCKHCGETLDVALRAAEEAKRESRRDRQSINVNQSTYVDVRGAGFNHGLHIVLDIITCGAWIPIHILCWVLR